MDDARDIRLTFDDVPALYERARPTYPAELVDVLFARLPDRAAIVEMGPGTGQLTDVLLHRGAVVSAVELGPALAATLADKHRHNGALTVINASFEAAELPDHSFDAVVAATAYHWVDITASVQRPLALLRPGGILAVFDLIQVDSPIDQGYFAAVQPIYDRHGSGRPSQSYSAGVPDTYEMAMPSIVERLVASDRYDYVEVHRHRWDQIYSSTQYRELLMTYSGTQMKPEPERSTMVDALIDVVDSDFAGTVTRPLCATLTVARARG